MLLKVTSVGRAGVCVVVCFHATLSQPWSFLRFNHVFIFICLKHELLWSSEAAHLACTCLYLTRRHHSAASASHLLTSFPLAFVRPCVRCHVLGVSTRRRTLRGCEGVDLGSAHAPSAISHCSSVAGFACSPRLLGRCGCHGDLQGCCCWWERWVCVARSLKIECRPEPPHSLNIDLDLMRAVCERWSVILIKTSPH